jgi:hypothetical protein
MNIIKRLPFFAAADSTSVRGISGFGDWKFFAAALAYAVAFLFFVCDPFFHLYGKFTYQQGVVILFFAVILASTFHWELLLFGKPSGANMLLQVISMIPAAFLLARIFGDSTKPVEKSFWAELTEKAADFTNEVIDISKFSVPEWITDMLRNWKISCVIIILLMILSLKIEKRFKVAAVFVALLIPFLTALAGDGPLLYLLAGSVCFAVGLCLQFCRYDKVNFFEQVDASLQQQTCIDAVALRTVIRIMTRLQRDGSVTENCVREIVAGEYASLRGRGFEYNDMEINQIASALTRKMVYDFDLVYINNTGNGSLMVPNKHLFVGKSILCSIAQWPRLLVIVIFAIVWTVMPVDILPDAIPFIGALDDVAMSTVACISAGSFFKKQ